MDTATSSSPPPVPAQTTAQRMLDAAICAYSIVGKTYKGIDFFNTPVGWGPSPNVVSGGEGRIDAGLIGETTDGWVVLSLRGTLSTYDSIPSLVAFFEDWAQDDKTHKVPFVPAPNTNFGLVHHGFLDAVMALWPKIEKQLAGRNWSQLQGLQITGHSKGAAMSFLCAVLAQVCLPSPANGGPKAIYVNAFAAPLVGDQAFAHQYAASGLEAHTIRYQRENDLVPFLPAYTTFDLLNYWHLNGYLELDLVRIILSATHGGYTLAGSLEYYPDHAAGAPWPSPVPDPPGQTDAQTAILNAINTGALDAIEDAHSAINSYWPSIFGQDLPQGITPMMAATLAASFKVEALAAAAGD